MALGLQKTSYSHRLMESGKVFAINIFDKAGADSIRPFTKSRAKNPDKMQAARFTPGPETGCPILEDAAAYIEFRVVEIVDVGGDHDVVVGEPVGAGVRSGGGPGDTLSLVDIGWSYAG